jgi:hypothetical protein
MTSTYKTNLTTTRNANLAEQHDIRERLTQLAAEETQLRGAIAVLDQIEKAEKAEAEKAEAEKAEAEKADAGKTTAES